MAPGAAAYNPNQPVVPPQSPTSLQGFMTPPQYSVPAIPPNLSQSPTSLQGFMTPPQYGQPTQQQMLPNGTVTLPQESQYLPMTNQLWNKKNG